MLEVGQPFAGKIAGHATHGQSEEIFDLSGKNSDSNATGKAHDDGIRHKFDDAAQLQRTHGKKHDACHDGCNDEAAGAESFNDTIHDDDESTGRSSDLNLASTQQGDKKTGNNGCNQAAFR
ncbi:MAG: hypothetical protein BWY72_01105 [Bacteroidetes bacterium ADurb.Bin416]|nr:MAG: hypothetical protein BWY72_01105 [Bacteroidetes bacterium ADurb.Bin416]